MEMHGTGGAGVADRRVDDVLAAASDYFESHLWDSGSSRSARDLLAQEGLDETVIRAFGVGYAPIGANDLLHHLRGLGYSDEELVAAGVATRSRRGRVHARFRSRIMFPVRDREGRTIGFAGLGTHLGPSWSLWVTSPATDLYRPAEAVFGLDRAAEAIAASGAAVIRPDCLEVLRAHQGGTANAVTVHTNRVTREQMHALAVALPGGIDDLSLDLPPGMSADPKHGPPTPQPEAHSELSGPTEGAGEPEPGHLNLKRLAIVVATAVLAMNVWTGAPLLALWVGSHVQSGRLLSYQGVITVVVVLAILVFLLGWALTWLSARYDKLTGRPSAAASTSPWHRSVRGDRVQDIRFRYGVSAPEKVVAVCVVAAVLAFEFWFFFLAGSSLPSS
jgi:hypothetical protein